MVSLLKGDGTYPNAMKYATYFQCGVSILIASLTLYDPDLLMRDFEKKGENEKEKDVVARFCTRIIACNFVGRAFYGIVALRSGDKEQLFASCLSNVATDVLVIITYFFNKDWIKQESFRLALGLWSTKAAIQLFAILKS